MDVDERYRASVERLLNLFTRPCHDGPPDPVQPGGGGGGARCGCDGQLPPHHFTLAEFGSRVLYPIYPDDYARLCPRPNAPGIGGSNQALAAIVKDWMGLPHEPPANGGQLLLQVAYPVVGRVFVDDLNALVAAERVAVQRDALVDAVIAAGPVALLPQGLFERISVRVLTPDSSPFNTEPLRSPAFDGKSLAQALQGAELSWPLPAALSQRIVLADGQALCLAEGLTVCDSPSLERSEHPPSPSTIKSEIFRTGGVNPDDLRTAARDFARRRALSVDSDGSDESGDDGSGGGVSRMSESDDVDALGNALEGSGDSAGSDGDGAVVISSPIGATNSARAASGAALLGDVQEELELSAALATSALTSHTSMATDAESDAHKCPVCLRNLGEFDHVVQLVGHNPAEGACGHEFCCACISNWLERKPECPLCRSRPGCQRIYSVKDGRRELIDELTVPVVPSAADVAEPDGVNGARHAPDPIVTAYHRSVLRVFRQLVIGSGVDTADERAYWEAAGASQGRELRPRGPR